MVPRLEVKLPHAVDLHKRVVKLGREAEMDEKQMKEEEEESRTDGRMMEQMCPQMAWRLRPPRSRITWRVSFENKQHSRMRGNAGARLCLASPDEILWGAVVWRGFISSSFTPIYTTTLLSTFPQVCFNQSVKRNEQTQYRTRLQTNWTPTTATFTASAGEEIIHHHQKLLSELQIEPSHQYGASVAENIQNQAGMAPSRARTSMRAKQSP